MSCGKVYLLLLVCVTYTLLLVAIGTFIVLRNVGQIVVSSWNVQGVCVACCVGHVQYSGVYAHAHVCALCVGGSMIFMGFQVSAVNMCVALGYWGKQCSFSYIHLGGDLRGLCPPLKLASCC